MNAPITNHGFNGNVMAALAKALRTDTVMLEENSESITFLSVSLARDANGLITDESTLGFQFRVETFRIGELDHAGFAVKRVVSTNKRAVVQAYRDSDGVHVNDETVSAKLGLDAAFCASAVFKFWRRVEQNRPVRDARKNNDHPIMELRAKISEERRNANTGPVIVKTTAKEREARLIAEREFEAAQPA